MDISAETSANDEAARAAALAGTRTASAPALAKARAVTAWLIDRGLSQADIDAIPPGVKADYLRLWDLGVVGPLAERRPLYMLLRAQVGNSARDFTIADIFPELRAVYGDL